MALVMNYSGRLIDPLDLQDEDFDNMGMQAAVTLSRLGRFWSQTRIFYSVAAHCLAMVEEFEGDVKLQKWAISHEIYEAISGIDLPSPLKHSEAYRPYREAEERALEQFARLYGMTPPMPKAVKVLDKAIMITEAEALMPYNPEMDWRQHGSPDGRLYKLGASEQEIRNDFLLKWQELFGKL